MLCETRAGILTAIKVLKVERSHREETTNSYLKRIDEPTRESTIERCGERGVGSNGFSSLAYCHVNCEQFQLTLPQTSSQTPQNAKPD